MHEQVMDVVVPDGTGWIEIAVAFVVAFLVSFLWWGPLFGKKWGKEMGMKMDPANRPSMALPMLWQAIGTFLFVYVLWNVMYAFTTGVDASGELMMNNVDWASGMMGAFFTWLGFFVPAQLGRVAWEKASWTLAGINAGGHLVSLVAVTIVFIVF